MLIQQVIESQPGSRIREALPAPTFEPNGNDRKVLLGMASFQNHMSSEGWQLQEGLIQAGYEPCGAGYEGRETDVFRILQEKQPGTVVVQDKREWDPKLLGKGSFSKGEQFTNCEFLASQPRVFRVTVLKDSHKNPRYHRQAALEIGCHAWICYYHPRLVKHFSGFVREEHLIRTYHTIDPSKVPVYRDRKRVCLLSGAICQEFYPLRVKIRDNLERLPGVDWLQHPGYHAQGTNTNQYLEKLSKYRVAICTASRLGYALRKIIEATACGCRVITDLPVDEVLPGIDGNLYRIEPNISVSDLRELIRFLSRTYEQDAQRRWSQLAIQTYNYLKVGRELAEQIKRMRLTYSGNLPIKE